MPQSRQIRTYRGSLYWRSGTEKDDVRLCGTNGHGGRLLGRTCRFVQRSILLDAESTSALARLDAHRRLARPNAPIQDNGSSCCSRARAVVRTGNLPTLGLGTSYDATALVHFKEGLP